MVRYCLANVLSVLDDQSRYKNPPLVLQLIFPLIGTTITVLLMVTDLMTWLGLFVMKGQPTQLALVTNTIPVLHLRSFAVLTCLTGGNLALH